MTDVDTFLAAHAAAPGVDPAIVYGTSQASAGNVPQAVQNTQTVAGFGQYTTLANNLRQQSTGAQRQAWGAFGPDEQSALAAAGYIVPKQSGGGGLFSQITNAIGDIQSGTGHVLTDVLGGLGSGLRTVQHVYRASRAVSESGMSPQDQVQYAKQAAPDPRLFVESFSNAFSPHQWAQAWNRTTNGEKTYEPGIVRQLQASTDPATFNLAKQIADANNDPGKIGALIHAAPQSEQSLLADRIQNDKAVRSIASQLMAAKMSPGRSLVGEKFQLDHPDIAKPISGVADAAFDWYGDPLNIGLKGIHQASEARYLIQSPDDVRRVAQLPQASHAFDLLGGYLGNGDAATAIERFPQMKNVIPQMVAEGVTDKASAIDWLASSSGMESFMSGRGGGISQVGQLLPHSGFLGDLGFAAKSRLTQAIDWTSQAGIPLIAGGSRTIDRIATLIPKAEDFDPTSPQAAGLVKQVADTVLSNARSKDVQNAFIYGDTIGEKRVVYKSLLNTMGEAIGVNDNPNTAKAWARIVDSVDENITSRVYSATANDRIMVNGESVASGIGANQVFGRWAIPDYSMMLAAKNKVTMGDKLLATVNGDITTALMQNAWKPLQLLRLGFSPRVAGEELFGAAMRDGAAGLLRARLAVSSVKGLENPDDTILPWHPLSHVWSTLTDHLSEDSKITAASGNLSDLASEMFGDRARRAFRNVEGAFAGAEYRQAAREMYDRYGSRFLDSEVSALHTNGIDRLDSPENTVRFTKQGIKTAPARLAPSGDFKNYAPDEPLFLQMLKKNIDDATTDPVFRPAVATFSQGRDAQVQAVYDQLDKDTQTMRRVRANATRTSYLSDGRVVGVDATKEDALRDWANVAVDHVNGLLTDHEGNAVPGLTDFVTENRRAPSVPELSALPSTRLPKGAFGPEMVPVAADSMYRNFLTRGFTEMVGRPMDWIARQPMFLHNYVLAKQETTGLRLALEAEAHGGDLSNIDAHMTDVNFERALNRTIPFIHDPEVKSMFAVNVKNLMPFEFAQEQFYKRWARTFDYAPEAFRKAQLISQGVRHSGLTHVDSSGNEYFMYPLMGQFQKDVLVPAIHNFLGVDASLPINVGFSGDVKMATPGLERLGAPSFGPLVAIPMKALASRYPELAPAEQSLLGAGASTSIMDQLLPSPIARFYHAYADTRNSSPQYASAMNQAMQYLEASGHGLSQAATPTDIAHWQDRVSNWTRTILVMRALIGFAGPASPTARIDYKGFNGQLQQLMTEMPMSDAVATLVARHPDALPYTVFQSTSKSEAPLPATASTVNFMDVNGPFLKSHRLAAGWFLPQDQTGKYDPAAYQQQVLDGLRQRKSPDQFYQDLKFAEASGTYYRNFDRYRAAKLTAKGAALQNIESVWANWQNAYFARNPLFAQIVNDPQGANKRASIIQELNQALAAPDRPSTPETAQIAVLMRNFNRFQVLATQLKAAHTTAANRELRRVQDVMANWGASFVATNPAAQGLYERIVRPEIGGAVAAQQAVTASLAQDAQTQQIDQSVAADATSSDPLQATG